MRPRIGLLFVALAVAAAGRVAPAQSPAVPADVVTQMRKVYGELASYTDRGTVTSEYGVSSSDTFTFTTCFNRAPRRFLLDFRKGAGQYVIWGDPDAFHTWWKTTGDRYDYPNPNNAPALTGSALNTSNTAQKIPTLLYAKAALAGDFVNVTSPTADGVEDVGGHRCHRFRQEISDTYSATGRQTNVRQLTVWIDAESLLVRKVLEEWKPLPGQRSRLITAYEPQANPKIDAAACQFTPPPKGAIRP